MFTSIPMVFADVEKTNESSVSEEQVINEETENNLIEENADEKDEDIKNETLDKNEEIEDKNDESASEQEAVETPSTEKEEGALPEAEETEEPETTVIPEATETPMPEINLEETINNGVKYSELSDDEKAEAQKQYGIRDDVFADCENEGFDLQNTLEFGVLIQNAGITASEYKIMLNNFESKEQVFDELESFANFKYSVPALKIQENAEYRSLFINGLTSEKVLQTAALSAMLGIAGIASYADMSYEEIETKLTEEQFLEYSSIMSCLSEVMPMEDEDETIYDTSKYPDAPFTFDRNNNETFNESSGALGYNLSGLSLPGKNGLDLNLSASYNTANSSPTDIGSLPATTVGWYKYETPLVNFAAGWSFNGISSINLINRKYGSSYRTDSILTASDGSTHTISYKSLRDSSVIELTLDGRYSYADLKFEKNTEYIDSDGGVVSAFKLYYKDGRIEYFDADGKVMKTQNRFGDAIYYRYYTNGDEINDDFTKLGQEYNKCVITDTCGRQVIVERKTKENYIQEITVKVLGSDGSEIEGTTQKYNIRSTMNTANMDTYAQILDSYTNQEGLQTTFKYQEGNNEDEIYSVTNFINRNFYILTDVIHPTGASTHYEYSKTMYSYNSLRQESARLIKRYDVVNGIEENVIAYDYSGSFMYNNAYSTTETTADGVITKHNYAPCYESTSSYYPNDKYYSYKSSNASGKFTLKESDEVYYMDGENPVYLSKTIYGGDTVRYYKRTYPEIVTSIIYDKEQNSIESTTISEYNEYRDLVKSWDAYANGDKTNTEHMTSYTYDDVYHTQLTKEYKRDGSTTVKEETVLSADSKVPAQSLTYENGNLVAKETYLYEDNNSANPSTVRSYKTGTEYTEQNITYLNKSLPLTKTVAGVTTSYTYDELGRAVSTTDGKGNVTYAEYDNLGRQISTRNPDGTTVTVEYPKASSAGQILENSVITKDGRGNKTKYIYDGLGKITTVFNCETNQTQTAYEYDTVGRISKIIDGNGNNYNYQYDKKSRKTKMEVKDAAGSLAYEESYVYDDVDGDLSKAETIKGSGAGKTVSAAYTDKYGNTVKETTGDGTDISETEYTYDYIGNKLNTKTPKAKSEGKGYTYRTEYGTKDGGTYVTTTDIDNNSTRVEKNMLGQEVKTIDPKKNESSAKYDDFGRQTEVKSRIDGGDSIKSYIYDNNGNVIKESITSNKPGETVTYRNVYYEYDNMNRLVKTYTDEPGETLYEYDGNGNITKMTTGAVNGEGGVSTTYEYDSQNRLISSTDPMGYSESYTYDNNGNIVSKTDKNGTVTTNVYNGINNPLSATSERDGETETITYTYADTSTALLSIANEAATITYSYDRKGQVTGESRTTGETLSYSYDKDGNQTGLILNSTNGVSQNISYSYDYLGKMKEVRDNLENELVAVYSYDENENLTEKKTNGNTMVTSYEYNESNLPKKVSNQTLADPLQNIKGTYSEYNYSYYLDGNQSSVTDIFGKTKGYTYDSAGRLKTEVNELNKKSNEDEKITTIYSYDERGNRISKEQTKDEVSLMIWTGPRPAYEEGEGYTQYYYDNNNRLTGSSYDYEEYMNEDKTFTYDKNGNMITRDTVVFYDDYPPEGSSYEIYEEKYESFEYNGFNRLKSYTDTNKTASYAYDGTGTRIGKTVNGVSTGQIWNNGNVIAEYGTKGTKTYIRGAGGEIVKTKDSTSNSRYFSYNAHGDTTNIIEKNAESTSFAVTAAYEYDAFGGLVTGTGGEADSNAFRYNGQYTDEETGLIYLRNRYYDHEIGRFTQEDTYWNPGNMIYGDQQFEEGEVKITDYHAIVQSANLYVYCANDPVNLNDIFGTVAGDRFATPDEAAIDWAWNYYGITQYSMIEHASLIYLAYDEYNTPYYSYTECVDGQPNYVQTTLLNTHINEGQYIVGAVHSHTVTNRLSNQDLDLAIDQNYSILYVVGESQYSDGVDISKIQDYDDGRGYQLEAVGSDYGFRHLTYSEQRNADVYFRNKWNWFYDELSLIHI